MSAGHDIPYSYPQIEDICAASLPDQDQRSFKQFSALLSAWYHHAMLGRLKDLKADYRRLLEGAHAAEFAHSLEALAQRANFARVSETMLTEVLAEESTFRLRLHVDFSAFKEVVFYVRGASEREGQVPIWLGLRQKPVRFTNYDRVLLYVHSKSADAGSPAVVLKLFENVPRADLEMLFPNTEVRMRLIDKLVIGIPAAVSGTIVFFTKVGSTLLLLAGLVGFWIGLSQREVSLDQATLVALVSGGAALGGFLWQQFNKFKNRKIRFMKALTEQLYFKNLDNHEGVITHLIDHAEESECKEVLLAYTTLLRHGPLNASALKQAIEQSLTAQVNFDVEDALAKLHELKLTTGTKTHVGVQPLAQATAQIDALWDSLFTSEIASSNHVG